MKQDRSILVVEDEQATRDLVCAQLGATYEVRSASNGEEAIAALTQRGFDLMLLDVNLPGISGLDVLEQISDLERAPTVIMVSADGVVANAVHALREGAYDYLVKPFSMEQLHTTLAHAVERNELVRENRSLRRTVRIATDFAGRLFFSKRQAVAEMVDESWPQWFTTSEWPTDRVLGINWDKMMGLNVHNDPVPVCCAGAIRHVHIDLSTTHCATGFCMGHIAGSMEVNRRNPENPAEKIREEAPIIHIDCTLRVVAPQGEEVDHGEVRGLVYRLMEKGVPIRSVSMDQYMAPSNLQLFKRRGLRTAEVGERKAQLKPYLAARQALYEGRVISAPSEQLQKEIRELELDKHGKKVKHPPRGSKDMADAWAGVIYYIGENMRSAVALGPSTGISEQSLGEGPRWTSGGDVIWGDEEDLPSASVPKNGQNFPPCIL